MRTQRVTAIDRRSLELLALAAALAGCRAPEESQAPAPAERAAHAGRITGTVLEATTGAPVDNAYVGAGDFGDSGGSNYERHRAQGLYASTYTDARGRFELDGLALTSDGGPVAAHPLVVTHRDFVPHRLDVAVPSDHPVHFVIPLQPAASIHAIVVDERGRAVKGPVLASITAEDDHRFIAAGRDPHLSAFAASAWQEVARHGSLSFEALSEGEYTLHALRFDAPVDGKLPPGLAGPPLGASVRFHGRVSVLAKIGARAEARIQREQHRTRLTIALAAAPPEYADKLASLPPIVAVSANPGLLVWDDGRVHSLEDPRLGRIQEEALFWGFVGAESRTLVVENLPPGKYAIFAGPAPVLLGARVDLATGDDKRLEVAWREPQEPGRARLDRFARAAAFEYREYAVGELCDALARALDDQPRVRADPALRDTRLQPPADAPSIWSLFETLHAERGWVLVEEELEGEAAAVALVLRPAP
jgi:hypothetical protein